MAQEKKVGELFEEALHQYLEGVKNHKDMAGRTVGRITVSLKLEIITDSSLKELNSPLVILEGVGTEDVRVLHLIS